MEQLFQVGEFIRGSKVELTHPNAYHDTVTSGFFTNANHDTMTSSFFTVCPNSRDIGHEDAVFGRHEHHCVVRIDGIRLHQRPSGRDVGHSAARRDAADYEVNQCDNGRGQICRRRSISTRICRRLLVKSGGEGGSGTYKRWVLLVSVAWAAAVPQA